MNIKIERLAVILDEHGLYEVTVEQVAAYLKAAETMVREASAEGQIPRDLRFIVAVHAAYRAARSVEQERIWWGYIEKKLLSTHVQEVIFDMDQRYKRQPYTKFEIRKTLTVIIEGDYKLTFVPSEMFESFMITIASDELVTKSGHNDQLYYVINERVEEILMPILFRAYHMDEAMTVETLRWIVRRFTISDDPTPAIQAFFETSRKIVDSSRTYDLNELLDVVYSVYTDDRVELKRKNSEIMNRMSGEDSNSTS